MVASLNLVHQNKLNTIWHKSTVVVVNGINLFNDPFLQEFPSYKDLLKLRNSTESAQNTSHILVQIFAMVTSFSLGEALLSLHSTFLSLITS
jgi:hypothetical protein